MGSTILTFRRVICTFAFVTILRIGAIAEYRDLLKQAETLGDNGDFDSAMVLALSAKEEALNLLEPDDTALATVLDVVAQRCYDNQAVSEARENWQQALAIRLSAHGRHHPLVAATLTRLAYLEYNRSHYRDADSIFTLAMDVWENLVFHDSVEYLRTVRGTANAKLLRGKYAQAERLYRQALDAIPSPQERDRDLGLKLQINLAVAWMWLGKYDEASELYEHIVSTLEGQSDRDDLLLAKSLSMLALIYRQGQKFEGSKAMSYRALRFKEEMLGPEHTELVGELANLAYVHRRLKEYKQAEAVCRRYIDLAVRRQGEDSPFHAHALAELARVLSEQGKLTEVEPVYDRAAAIYERMCESGMPNIVAQLERFVMAFHRYRPNRTLRIGYGAFRLRYENVVANSSQLSEVEALRFARFMRRTAGVFLGCFFDEGSPDDVCREMAAEIVFASKGAVSDEMFRRRQAVAQDTDSTVTALMETLKRTKNRLADLHVSGPSGRDSLAYYRELDSLSETKGFLETGLAIRSTWFRKQLRKQQFNAAQVYAHIPENCRLVEYMRFFYHPSDRHDATEHYLAAVADADQGLVAIRDLGPAAPIDSTVAAYRRHVLAAAENDPDTNADSVYRSIAVQLHALLWQPLEATLPEGNLILIAPDGPLILVSFAGLVDSEGRYMVERFPIHYLTAGRDLLRLHEECPYGRGLLAVGNPDFDAPADVREEASLAEAHSHGYLAPPPKMSDVDRHRNVRHRCRDVNEIFVRRLPGTAAEIAQLDGLWNEVTDEEAILLQDRQATEDNFCALASGKRVLHLATHGFCIPASCLPETEALEDGTLPPLSNGYVEDNPLLLSGLLLAGCNLHGAMADSLGIDDGILTAEEVSNLDLKGVQRVVLSACESGLGDIWAGEGVYGLRRAFEMAGARTVVSSIWPVADRVTVEFMSRLYTDPEVPTYESIRRYQLKEIGRLRSYGYSDHPVRWAAFISSGDWH